MHVPQRLAAHQTYHRPSARPSPVKRADDWVHAVWRPRHERPDQAPHGNSTEVRLGSQPAHQLINEVGTSSSPAMTRDIRATGKTLQESFAPASRPESHRPPRLRRATSVERLQTVAPQCFSCPFTPPDSVMSRPRALPHSQAQNPPCHPQSPWPRTEQLQHGIGIRRGELTVVVPTDIGSGFTLDARLIVGELGQPSDLR